MTILFNLFPDEKYIKYIRIFAGFILIFIILIPITKYKSSDINIQNIINHLAIDVETVNLEEELDEYESVITDRIERQTDMSE